MVVLLVSCAAPTGSVTEPGSATADSSSSGDSPIHQSDESNVAIASTCASISVIQTTIGNARRGLADASLSDDQYAVLIDSAYVGFKSVLAFPPDQRGLRTQVEGLVAAIDAEPPAPGGVRFNVEAATYSDAIAEISELCEQAGSEVAGYSTSGG
jgi:hypothetical protein